MLKRKVNKARIAFIIILVLAVATVGASAVTYGIWKENLRAQKVVEIPMDYEHPSLKYLIFSGLDAGGNYTDASPVAYAAVGYTGLVSEVWIPDTYNGLPVTRIATNGNYSADKFSGNKVITVLRISCAVTSIANGACQNMISLKRVVFNLEPYDYVGTGYVSGNVNVGAYAFTGCTALTNFNAEGRGLTGAAASSYLFGTPLA